MYFKGRQNLTELKFVIKGKTFLQTKQTKMASQLVNLLNVLFTAKSIYSVKRP